MADISKVVEIIFQGDDKLSKTVDSVAKGFGDLEAATAPLANVAKDVLAMEGALATLAAGGMLLAVKESGNFNEQIQEINTLIGLTDEDLLKFKDDIIDYAKDSSLAIEDINEAVYDAVSAGTEYKDVLGLLNEAEELAVGGRAELKDTTKLLASAINAYGKETKDAGEFSDALFQAVKFGATTIPELSDALGGIIGIAAAAGIEFDELAAGVAGITATSGVSTAEAVTQLKGVINSLIKPTGEAAKLANSLGLEFNAAALESKGLNGVLKDVVEATDGNIESMGVLFGSVEGLAGALTLGKDESGKFGDALEGMETKMDAAKDAYETMAGEMTTVNQNLANNVKTAIIAVGDDLRDEYVAVVRGLTDIFKGVEVGIDEGTFDPIIDLFEEFGKDAAELLSGIADALPEAFELLDLTELVGSIEGIGDALTGALEAIFGDIDITTPEGLAAAMQAVVDAITNLNDIVGGVIEGLTPFFELISTGYGYVSDLDPKIFELGGKIAGMGLAVSTAAGFISSMVGGLQALGGSKIVGAITNVGDLGLKASGSLTSITGLATKVIALAGPLGMPALGIAAAGLGTVLLTQLAPHIGTAFDKLFLWADEVFNITGLQKDWRTGTEDLDKAVAALEENVALAKDGFIKYKDQIIAIPGKATTEIDIENLEPSKEDIDEMIAQINEVPESKYTTMGVTADIESVTKAEDAIYDLVSEGILVDFFSQADTETAENAIAEIEAISEDQHISIEAAADIFSAQQANQTISENVDGVIDVNAFVTADEASAKEAQETIDKNIDKQLDIQAKIDLKEIDLEIEQVKAQAATLQTAVEWKAKLDIAEVEASAAVLQAAFESIDVVVQSTGDTLSAYVTALGDAEGRSRSIIEQQIDLENDRRDEALRLQKELTEAEIKLIEEKTRLLGSKQYTISIDAAGLEPHLNAIWMEIMSSIQAEIVETGGEFLIGV
jgi:TP901 family phage tail tape measure protein